MLVVPQTSFDRENEFIKSSSKIFDYHFIHNDLLKKHVIIQYHPPTWSYVARGRLQVLKLTGLVLMTKKMPSVMTIVLSILTLFGVVCRPHLQ